VNSRWNWDCLTGGTKLIGRFPLLLKRRHHRILINHCNPKPLPYIKRKRLPKVPFFFHRKRIMADNNILLGGNGVRQILLNAGMANRHGLITGATGTGKTVTLQVLAESFSSLGRQIMRGILGSIIGGRR
jgi:hypothetical protein